MQVRRGGSIKVVFGSHSAEKRVFSTPGLIQSQVLNSLDPEPGFPSQIPKQYY
jgi:hypothetical protein